MWVPIGIIALILILWFVVARRPADSSQTARTETVAVVQEAQSTTAGTATITEIAPPGFSTTTTSVPSDVTQQPVTEPATDSITFSTQAPVPAPVAPSAARVNPSQPPTPARTVVPAPTPARRAEQAPAPASRGGELGESETIAVLRDYIGSRAEYASPSDCLVIASEGYKNRGYTLSVRNRCDGHSFGRWRVDTLTREVFRQRPHGRFLKP